MTQVSVNGTPLVILSPLDIDSPEARNSDRRRPSVSAAHPGCGNPPSPYFPLSRGTSRPHPGSIAILLLSRDCRAISVPLIWYVTQVLTRCRRWLIFLVTAIAPFRAAATRVEGTRHAVDGARPPHRAYWAGADCMTGCESGRNMNSRRSGRQ